MILLLIIVHYFLIYIKLAAFIANMILGLTDRNSLLDDAKANEVKAMHGQAGKISF